MNSLHEAKDHSSQSGSVSAISCHFTPFGADKVCPNTSLSLADALNEYLTPQLEHKAPVDQNITRGLKNLNPTIDPSAVHPTRKVYCHAPDIILGFGGAYDACNNRAVGNSCRVK